jgi:hypothetical protein
MERQKRPIIGGKTVRAKYRGKRDLLRQLSRGTGRVSSTHRSSPPLYAPKSDAFSSNRDREGETERLVPASCRVFKRLVCCHIPK